MKKTFLLTLLMVCSSIFAIDADYFTKLQTERVASSDSLMWEQIGPGSAGYCEKFWCHPTDSTVMFMGPDMHVAYGSWDDGKTWQTIKDCDGTGRFLERMQDMDFSRQNPDFGMAIDISGWYGDLKGPGSFVYVTNDRGHTWESKKRLGKGHSCIAVDPSNDKIWYIGSGGFWDVKMNHRSEANPHGVIQSSRYAYGLVWKTIDGGETWTKINKNLPSDLDVGKIIVDPDNSENVIMATNYGLYKSSNGGTDWTLDGGNLPFNMPRDLAIYHDDDITILYCLLQTKYKVVNNSVTATGGVYISQDFGKNWICKNENLGSPIGAINYYSCKQKYINAVSFWTGKSKTEISKLNVPNNILAVYNRIVVNPKNKTEVYLMFNTKHDKSFGPGSLIKTDDLGKWYICARAGKYWNEEALKDQATWNSLGVPTSTNTKFGHLRYEVDNSYFDSNSGTRSLAIGCDGDVHIQIGQQYLRSYNHGKSWVEMDDYETEEGSDKWIGRGGSNLPGRGLLTNTGDKSRIFLCSGEHGLWQIDNADKLTSKDPIYVQQIEGQCEEKYGISDGATSVYTVAVNPKNSRSIYTVQPRQNHRDDLMKSTDNGKTWHKVSTCVETHDNNISLDIITKPSLLIDYNDTTNIYFNVERSGTYSDRFTYNSDSDERFNNFGVYKSTDDGLTWKIMNSGLPEICSVTRIVLDPKNPQKIYACLDKCKENNTNYYGGLYVSLNGAETWEKANYPSIIKSVKNLHFDINGVMYLSAEGVSSVKEGGVWKSKDNGASWTKIFEMPSVIQTVSSPIDPNTLILSSPWTSNISEGINPGVYISRNGGDTWVKVNKNLGQPNKIMAVQPDQNNVNTFWIASWGCGWYRGIWGAKNNVAIDLTKSKSDISINQNPVKETLLIDSTDNAFDKLVMYDLFGKIVKVSGFNNSINISNIKQGMYILSFSLNGQIVNTSKIIKD